MGVSLYVYSPLLDCIIHHDPPPIILFTLAHVVHRYFCSHHHHSVMMNIDTWLDPNHISSTNLCRQWNFENMCQMYCDWCQQTITIEWMEKWIWIAQKEPNSYRSLCCYCSAFPFNKNTFTKAFTIHPSFVCIFLRFFRIFVEKKKSEQRNRFGAIVMWKTIC